MSGLSSTTVSRSPSRASYRVRHCIARSWNAASRVIVSSPRQFSIEMLGDDTGTRQAMIEREPRCANEKQFRDDAGIGNGRRALGGFFNHLLLFRLEAYNLCETLVAKLGIRLEADGVYHQRIRFWKSV